MMMFMAINNSLYIFTQILLCYFDVNNNNNRYDRQWHTSQTAAAHMKI